jgi:hypothetical protein
MRSLTEEETNEVIGKLGVSQLNLPAGAKLTTELMPNNSTTISVTLANGASQTWNSGTYLTCTLISAGVGGAAWAFSGGNPMIGGISSMLASFGCSLAIGGLDSAA